MNADRRAAIWAGVFYILASAAPISTLFFVGFLGGGVAGETAPDYLATLAANETQVVIGMLVEMVWALAVVGVLVNLYPILRKHSEVAALGFSALRFIEAISDAAGSILLLTLLTLSQEAAKAGVPEVSYFQATGDLLLAAREWNFLIGSGLVWSLSALVLNAALYQSRLVPRWLSVWGFAGAVLSIATYVLQPFGVELTDLVFAPIGVQEMVFAVWLIVKGVDLSAVASEPA
jgi:hypothetical protein